MQNDQKQRIFQKAKAALHAALVIVGGNQLLDISLAVHSVISLIHARLPIRCSQLPLDSAKDSQQACFVTAVAIQGLHEQGNLSSMGPLPTLPSIA